MPEFKKGDLVNHASSPAKKCGVVLNIIYANGGVYYIVKFPTRPRPESFEQNELQAAPAENG